MKLKVLDLFSGIGGFSLGLECTGGFETVAFCEIEEYPRKVLAKHWPGVPIYDDVRELTAERLVRDGIGVDVITGGFPCQDISVAGLQGGIEADRSGLWSECARLLGDIGPQWAIFENVPNLLNGNGGAWFKRVLWDISQVGYDAEWHCIPASHIRAPHRRDRIWVIAYPNRAALRKQSRRSSGQDGESQTKSGDDGKAQSMANAHKKGLSLGQCIAGMDGSQASGYQGEEPAVFGWWAVESGVGRVANGVPRRVDRIKALGNAVVPQIPEIIGRAILAVEAGK